MIRSRFHKLLFDKLKEVLDDRSNDLTSGTAKNYEQYQYQVGYLDSIKDVLKICEGIDDDEFGASS